MRREEHDRHKRNVARIQCMTERLLPSKSVPVRSLKVRLHCSPALSSGSVAGLAGSDTSPRDQRGGSDIWGVAGADLSSATHGYTSDAFRRGRGGEQATPSPWLS